MSNVTALKRTDDVVSEQAAEEEFARFVEAMDFDVDKKGMDDEDRKSFLDQKRRIIRAIVSGKLAIDERGQPVLAPSDGSDRITFYEPTGNSLVAMDQRKQGHELEKLFTYMADLTRVPEVRLRKLPARDVKVCIAITSLFLAG